MKRSLAIAAGVVSLLALGVVLTAFYCRAPAEPSYRGKPLSYWLTNLNSGGNEALAALGTNAVPYLAKALVTKSLYHQFLRLIRPMLPTAILQRVSTSRCC